MAPDKKNLRIINGGYQIKDSDNLLIERYKIYLESIERVSEKRQNANSYFLTINSGVCVPIGFILSKDLPLGYKSFF